jgi:GDPmannose 4,6-dehydratase
MARKPSLGMNGCIVAIFGASGQDGPYVATACRKRGALQIHTFSRSTKPSCNVSCYDEVAQAIKSCRPDFVFQLAAESRTAHDALFDNHAAIATGALNILEAVRKHAPRAKVLLASSGLQFYNDGSTIHEHMSFEARSPYAASRIYATYLARYYREQMGITTYVAYLFHHESPSRTVRHTSKMIAMAAARASLGAHERLQLGDLDVEKEWAFAGDISEGMVQLIMQNDVSECVIGTGESHSIKDWLEACYSHVGLRWENYVETRPGFVAEYPRLVSNPKTIHALGWWPEIGFSKLAGMLVDAALQELTHVAAST